MLLYGLTAQEMNVFVEHLVEELIANQELFIILKITSHQLKKVHFVK